MQKKKILACLEAQVALDVDREPARLEPGQALDVLQVAHDQVKLLPWICSASSVLKCKKNQKKICQT